MSLCICAVSPEPSLLKSVSGSMKIVSGDEALKQEVI